MKSKGLLYGLLILVVVIGAGLYYTMSNIGSFITAAVEKYGSEFTQVSVTLDETVIDITSGKGAMNGLTVGNPADFNTPYAIKLAGVSLQIDPSSLGSDTIIVKEVAIDGPEITYEIGGSGSNIAAIQENVERMIGGAGDTAPASDEESSSEGPKVVIEHLYVRGGKVNVSATLLQGKTLTSPLPDIHLTDIGKEEGGASAGEVIAEVMDAIAKSAGSAASSVDLSALGLSDISGKAMDAVGAIGDTVKGGASGAGDALKDGAGSVTEGIKGLFGN